MTPPPRTAWERVQRVIAYDSLHRARYPSIVRSADGDLLVLFTQQTESQEQTGRGDLLLVRSHDEGQTWSDPIVVFKGTAGEPRAVGTMTLLSDGRIIAPFVEFGAAQCTSAIHTLSADGAGQNWEVAALAADCPLTWWAPCGRIVEASGHTLAMPVYGAASDEHLKATIHGCGLLRSRESGKTWGDFSWIAAGPGAVIGAAPNRRFSFEGPSIQPLPDGRWLAMLTARRLKTSGDAPSEINEGPGAPQVVCRLYSHDEGRTWTQADQLLPGAWPSVAAAGSDTLCVITNWSAWGDMRLAVSSDGFDALVQETGLMLRGWLEGMGNRPQETPLPPTVPHLADAWPFEHYGFPSILLLDQDNAVVVFGRTRNGKGHSDYPWDPPQWRDLPIDSERIQAVFFRRTHPVGDVAAPSSKRPARPPGRWALVDRFEVRDLRTITQAPDGDLIGDVGGSLRRSGDGGRTWRDIGAGTLPQSESIGAFGVLNTGRWLVNTVMEGERGGYDPKPILHERSGYHALQFGDCFHEDTSVVVWRSDDEGRTWRATEPFKGPLQSAMHTACRFIECPDGTVALPICGQDPVDEQGDRIVPRSNGVIRSYDGGETWGDFSYVFRAQPMGPDDLQREPSFSEMDIVPLANGHWVAYSRADRTTLGPRGRGSTPFAISTDLGRTWHDTDASLAACHQQKGIALPDGGIAFTFRAHSWQGPGVAISYDEGRSFDYLLTGPYETINAFAHGKDEFVVFSYTSHRSDSMAGLYRWVCASGRH